MLSPHTPEMPSWLASHKHCRSHHELVNYSKITKGLPNSTPFYKSFPTRQGTLKTHTGELLSSLMSSFQPPVFRKEPLNNSWQVRLAFLARGRELLAPSFAPCPACQVTIGRLPQDFPHSGFRGSAVFLCSDKPEKGGKKSKLKEQQVWPNLLPPELLTEQQSPPIPACKNKAQHPEAFWKGKPRYQQWTSEIAFSQAAKKASPGENMMGPLPGSFLPCRCARVEMMWPEPQSSREIWEENLLWSKTELTYLL